LVLAQLFRRLPALFLMLLASCSIDALAQPSACRNFEANDKIVGGKPAKIAAWPGLVALRSRRAEPGSAIAYFCGGTLIDAQTVLTAAHCVAAFIKRPDGYYYGGQIVEVVYYSDNLANVKNDQVRGVREAIKHENYESAQRGDDIALLRLTSPVTASFTRLPRKGQAVPTASPLMVAGFGATAENAARVWYKDLEQHDFFVGTPILLEVAVPAVSQLVCAAAYPGHQITEKQVCAGYREGGRDSCQGDSGGPLVAFDANSCPYQVGVVSWGNGCARGDAYGIYTNVASYSDWILKNVSSLRMAEIPERKSVDSRSVVGPVFNPLVDLLGPVNGKASVQIRGGATVNAGTNAVFDVASKTKGDLLLIDINARGEVVQLFPNVNTKQRKISGKLSVPDNNTYRLPAGEPYGKGRIVALVTPSGFAQMSGGGATAKGFSVEQALTKQENGLSYFQNLLQQIRLSLKGEKGFGVKSTQPLAGWALGYVDYEITPPRK
jgi:trypsin